MSNGVVGGTLLGVLSILALMVALSSQPPFIPAALLPAGGLIFMRAWFLLRWRIWRIQDTPTYKAGHAKPGPLEVTGRIAVKDGQVLTPPGVEAAATNAAGGTITVDPASIRFA